jgi:hypothetical protein
MAVAAPALPAAYLPFIGSAYSAPRTVEKPVTTLGTVLSPSQVRCLMDCSARWWYKYGLQISEPQNGNLAIGSAVHAAIAFNFSEKIATGKDQPIGEVLSHYAQDWEAVSAKAEFRDDENPAELERAGAGLVEKYMREAAPQIQPAAVEVAIEGTISGVKVQGKLDVIETNGRVRDIKTSSRRSSDITNEQRFQLATYVPFAPGATGEVVIDQLVKTQTPQYVQLQHTVTRADIAATEQMYPHAQAVMRGQLYMPNRTSNLCSRRNCAYWSRCQRDFGGRVSA